ncbi:MAG: tRNA 2-thiouridine(34) synthase MnmA [Anaerolineae bacterium]|nr:tRNA 2-thiouridine(34) synthase MnmA [Anaerolineae bacterium]
MADKVVVAMSGGVDSSVAAGLLVEQGYDVTGMMLKMWVGDCDHAENACCTPESIAQAREVASQFHIPFYVIDVKEAFKLNVVDYFIQAYQGGLTPNPCFHCNRTIKWGELLRKASDMGADFIATGHYARILKEENGLCQLVKGADERKDQTYALSGLTQSQLQHTIFPLGGLLKSEVREKARKYGLTVSEKEDSQDLCFVGAQGYRGFLKQYGTVLAKPGLIKKASGDIVGEHQGLNQFTIGQRKGLGSGLGIPYYVISLDSNKNEVIIGTQDELGQNVIFTNPFNWISGNHDKNFGTAQVKIRYKSIPVSCNYTILENGSIRIVLDKPVRDATPGQIAVLYNEDEVLGSGIIQSTMRE